MPKAVFRFYAELNDFLPREWRQRDIEYSFLGRPMVKDAIEALGVPHVEVDLVLANGESVPLEYHLQDGDRIAVYPVFESLDISDIVRIRRRPLRRPRFVADVHLGKLVRYLRLLGLDVESPPDASDEELVRISAEEGRILLTRDRHLLKHGSLTHGYWVRSDDPVEQAREVIRRFDLEREIRPFSRCLACNGPLVPVPKEEVLGKIPPRTAAWLDEFYRCRRCGKLYWPGTHYRRLRRVLDEILGRSPAP
ncbi:Mut7-C ubiquitin/RNAse domain-containing protein [Candidatus Bipolaricaulota bacterium]|nr:Mut7-C ubiquitin/RNAse domain-containing protein [Candidatus Bipolaricaulota bacterium]